jgi:hypothetical protein
VKAYQSLYKLFRSQSPDTAFAHFYAIGGDYDEPFRLIARQTMDGPDAWGFQQDRFKQKYGEAGLPKLRNYLNYTFRRLVDLENERPGEFFVRSNDGFWICFNTGLQNVHGADLIAIFELYKPIPGAPPRVVPDWVFKGCYTPSDSRYRDRFGSSVPALAWYSNDSRDYVFDTSYHLERDVFDHLFERAKERAGMPAASDEVVRNYLRGALENLIPKIQRNYKVAIPVWYVEEKRMQMLLPFYSASGTDVSCFLVERVDSSRRYCLKTIFDLDQAYFSARLITRPDKDWLNP